MSEQSSETRHKLKPKQWEAIVQSTMRMNAAKQQVALEEERAGVESSLIMESLGLDPDTKVRLDPETKEIVVIVNEVVTPKARAPRTKRDVQ
jgi:hypothetical protein